ncbi:unnamed protein product [Phytomonas sp. Hart1]|nr:unnamed protein product [Phytomonas sp. Hart1]|eukprot:CCW65907.1 unnamed protein product [Phytomonas sp. isolate Hart1]
MLEEDKEAIRQLKVDLVRLVDLPDKDFKCYLDPASRMKYYYIVYTAATHNTSKGPEYSASDLGEVLYMDYHEIFTSYLCRFRDLTTPSEMDLFRKILNVWGRYKSLMNWSIWSFSYLSRYFIVNHSKPTLQQVALGIFFERIFKLHFDILSRITQDLLIKDTLGHSMNQSLITIAVDLFSSLRSCDIQRIYFDRFLHSYIERLTGECKNLLQMWSTDTDGITYLIKVHEVLSNVGSRCREYFSNQEEQLIISSIENTVINLPIARSKLIFSDNGFFFALHTRNEDALKKYYDLLSRNKSGIKLLSSSVREEIENESCNLSQLLQGGEETANVVQYLTSIIKLQEVFQHLVTDCFQSNFRIARAVQEGLVRIFNGKVQMKNPHTEQEYHVLFCELLASYIDIVLQKMDDSVNEEIENVVSVVMHLVERDCFLLCLKDRLFERITFPNKKFHEVNEWLFIEIIKQRWGSTSTAHLEGMLNDFLTSKSFKAVEVFQSLGKTLSFDVSVLFARKGIWPDCLSVKNSLILPHFIKDLLNHLQDAYLRDMKGRALVWSHEASSAELKAIYEQGTYIFRVSGIQALILLSFNTMPEQSIHHIMTVNGISSTRLRQSLPPLTKHKVLLHSYPLSQVEDTSERLIVNDNYTDCNCKINFPPTLAWANILNNGQTMPEAGKDRKLAIDTCLVRILKSFCTIDHEDLVAQCQNQLRPLFSPDVITIKQRVEELIQKGYIERAQGNHSKYKYIA